MNFELNFQFSIFTFQFKRRHRVTSLHNPLLYNVYLVCIIKSSNPQILKFSNSQILSSLAFSLLSLVFLLGVPAIAVGLSAISFSAALQKDAASIPNAWGLLKINFPF